MQTKPLPLFLSIAFVFATLLATANTPEHNHEGEHHEEVDLKSQIKEDIDHHLKDSHDYHLFSDEANHKHYGFPLPVVLIDEGLVVFMSSEFHHDDEGKVVVEKNGKRYVKHHSKIYHASATANHHGSFVEMDENHHAANTKPLDFSITKNVFNIIVISLILFWLMSRVGKSYKSGLVPTGPAKFIEPLVVFVRDEIAIPNIGEHKYKRFMPYLLTIFFFIWLVNLFGLTPLGVNITNSISVTFALALLTFIITQVSGNKNYWGHIFWMPGVPTPMKIILAPIELLGVFIKPFALMIRLYANITAGHIVIMSLIGLMFVFKSWVGGPLSFGLTFAISLLELLVAALQAYIFTMLSALYFGSAVAEHHDDH